MELPRLTVLNDRYAIRSVLGQLGPFEITYSAWDLNEEQQVVLREYFPVNLAVRQIRNDVIAKDSVSLPHFQYGYERYKKESQVLSKIKHPNVVLQLDYFEAYGTCYRVFEYHQGAVLERVLGEDSAQLAERSALSILIPFLEGLSAGHQNGLIHGRISPHTLFLSKVGRPMLLSFFTAQVLLASRLKALGSYVDPCFAPPEQTSIGGRQGPWSDIYSCGASLYYILTGEFVPPASDRRQGDMLPGKIAALHDVSQGVKQALIKSLEIDPGNRIASIDEFREYLTGVYEPTIDGSKPSTGSPKATAPPHIPADPESGSVEPPLDSREDRFSGQHTIFDAPSAYKPTEKQEERADVYAVEPENPVSGDGTGYDFQDSVEFVDEESETRDMPVLNPEIPSEEIEIDFLKGLDHTESELIPPPPIRDDEDDIQSGQEFDYSEDATAPSDYSSFVPPPPEEPYGGNGQYLQKKATHAAEDTLFGNDDSVLHTKPYEQRKARRNLMPYAIGTGILAIVLLGLFWFMFKKDAPADNMSLDRSGYDRYVYQGDSLFTLGRTAIIDNDRESARTFYELAKNFYIVAASYDQDQAYLDQRLKEINDFMAMTEDTSLGEKEYLSLLREGDSLMRRGDDLILIGDSVRAQDLYTEARQKYRVVLGKVPEDSLANARVKEAGDRIQSPPREAAVPPVTANQVQTRLPESSQEYTIPEPSQSQINAQQYALHRSEGDAAFNRGELLEAERRYVMALEARPNDEYARNMLARIDQRNVDASRDRQFQNYVNEGNRLRASGDLEEARREYEKAIDLKPDDANVVSLINDLRAQIDDQQQRNQAYTTKRAQADLLYERKDFLAALTSYQEALQLKPDDAYVKSRIDEVNQEIEQLETAAEPAPTGMIDRNGIYVFTEEPPEVVGGIRRLRSRIRYPARAQEAGIQGRVSVRMLIDENGEMSSPSIVQSLGYGCDDEVLRVLRNARFTPGRVSGNAVKSWHTLYFDFTLDDQ